MLKKFTFITFTILNLMFSTILQADEIIGEKKDDEGFPNIGWGVFSSYSKEIIRGGTHNANIIPVFPGIGSIILLLSTPVEFDLYSNHNFIFKSNLEYFDSPWDKDDFDFTDDMDKRKYSLFTGISVEMKKIPFSISLRKDVSKHSYSEIIDISYSYKISKYLESVIKFSHFDRDFCNYYYGVHANEAIPGRPFYSAFSDKTLNFELSYNHKNSNNIFMSSISYEKIPDSIKNSPIVEEDFNFSISIGVLWIKK